MSHSWTFVTNHANVLVAINTNPRMTMRDIAAHVGITERATQMIVRDLIDGGYVTAHKDGRQNIYEVNRSAMMRHPMWREHEVSELIDIVLGSFARESV